MRMFSSKKHAFHILTLQIIRRRVWKKYQRHYAAVWWSKRQDQHVFRIRRQLHQSLDVSLKYMSWHNAWDLSFKFHLVKKNVKLWIISSKFLGAFYCEKELNRRREEGASKICCAGLRHSASRLRCLRCDQRLRGDEPENSHSGKYPRERTMKVVVE